MSDEIPTSNGGAPDGGEEATASSAEAAPSTQVSEYVEAIRHDSVHVLAALIEDRDNVIADPIEVDLEEAERQANVLLDEHALAIAELGVNGLFELVALPRSTYMDARRYREVLTTLSNEEIAAQARADATGSTEAVEILRRRRELASGLSNAAQLVVRGVLGAALLGAIGKRVPLGPPRPAA